MRFLFIFLFIYSGLAFGQNRAIDSLKKVIATTKVDTVKGRSLCRLCGELENEGKAAEAQKYLDEGMKLSKKVNDLQSVAICLRKLGVLQIYSYNEYDKGIATHLEEAKICTRLKNEFQLRMAHSSIGVGYLKKGDLENALRYTRKYLQSAQKANHSSDIADAYNNLGMIYQRMGDYPQTLTAFYKSIDYYTTLGDSVRIANSLVGVGSVHYFMGNYPKALAAFNRALHIGEKLKNPNIIANHTNNIGNIYHFLNEPQNAIKYYEKSLLAAQSAKNEQMIAYCYNNLAGSYHNLDEHRKALEYYLKSLEIKEKKGSSTDILTTVVNIAKTNNELKDYLSAEKYFVRASALADSVNDPEAKSYFLESYGRYFFNIGKFNEAQKAGYESLKIAREIGHLEYVEQSAKLSALADSALGNFRSAYEHYKLYKQYSDSLHSEDKAKEFGKIESKYEFEKQAEAEKRLQQIKIREKQRQNNLQYLIISVGIIGLFMGLAFSHRLKIPYRLAETAIFTGLLILFEFLLILSGPNFEKISGGNPSYKLIFNTLIALAYTPLHSFLESKLKRRLVKGEKA